MAKFKLLIPVQIFSAGLRFFMAKVRNPEFEFRLCKDAIDQVRHRVFHFGRQVLSYRKGLPFDSVEDQPRRAWVEF